MNQNWKRNVDHSDSSNIRKIVIPMLVTDVGENDLMAIQMAESAFQWDLFDVGDRV